MANQLQNALSVVTERNFLKDLQSSSNKVILSSDDTSLLPTYIRELDEINFYEFNYIGAKNGLHAKIVPLSKNSSEDELVEIQWAPQFLLGFLSLSKKGQQSLEPLADWWKEKGKNTTDAISHIKLDSQCNETEIEACFWRQISHQLLYQTTSLSKRISSLHHQYLSLRELHEDMQNAFSTVEDFLSQAKLPNLQLKFENSPTKMLMTPIPQKNFVLRQLLPIGSKGLAAVDLHVGEESKGQGKVLISIEIPEDRTYLAKWIIDYQQFVKGWLHLDLPRIDVGLHREIMLKLEFQTQNGSTPCFSLGTRQPVPECQVYVESNESFSLSYSLAFKLWSGLPGTRRAINPYSTDVVGENNNLSPINAGYLGQRSLLSVKDISTYSAATDFQSVRVLDEGQKILVHPRQDQLTIAMLPHCFPSGFRYLTATVATENPKADKIEYAMAIVTDERDAQAYFNSDSSEQTVPFSGWKEVEPETTAQLTVSVEVSEAEAHHIVIATRLPIGSSPYFGWAHWLNFYIER